MNSDLELALQEIGTAVRAASRRLACAEPEIKNKAIIAMADGIQKNTPAILDANKVDIEKAAMANLSAAKIDRLRLDKDRILAIANSTRSIAKLPEPVGRILATDTRPNGLVIEKVSIPIGVIGVIYESRPNVTADAAALCLKSGNAVVLRGGSAAENSNRTIFDSMVQALTSVDFDRHVIQLVPSTSRVAVGHMLQGLNDNIDVIVPRGGRSLVERVQAESRVPVFAHLEGICHTYVHRDADPNMAAEIVLNAKLRRTGICGATETLLVDRQFHSENLLAILQQLHQQGCQIRGDEEIVRLFPSAERASAEDWSIEYLDSIISVKTVADVDNAIQHIDQFGTHHTEAIITDDQVAADYFLNQVGSAIVMHNTSTQFADGGEFGMGAEIGISTGKLHARGPVGVEQLTTFKYIVRGSGQTRP